MSVVLALLAAAAASADAAPDVPAPTTTEDVIVTGARTDGSDEYTIDKQITATRLNITQRETPQSISIVTRAQIEDFQLNDVNQLLATVPGVNVQSTETDRTSFSARGFDIQTFQIDGIGVPFAFELQTGSIDTTFYDHIEVLKGAPGLLSSTGNPSAVVNFIRKRPSKDFQASASAQYGSYDSVRLDGDVSVPLTHDGGIRARAVGAYFDTDSYLDRYRLRRWVGYGIVEADLGASTTLSAGYGHQDHKSHAALWGAIPITYTDGTQIDFDRSGNVAPDWTYWNVIDRQLFGDVTHHMGDWIARVSLIRRATSEDDKLFYVYGNPVRGDADGIDPGDPADPFDDKAIFSYPGAFRAQTRNLTAEAYVTGPVTLFGRKHDVMLGVNRSAQTYRQYSSYDFSKVGIPLAYPDLFAGAFPLPDFPTSYDLSLDQHLRRETLYGLVRLSLADPLKVMLGGNVTHAKTEGYSYDTPTNFDNTRFLPFAGATLDFSTNVSAYASYATIFNPQTQIGEDGRVLDPIRGDNLEAGIKGEWFGGRLNATAALFRTRQDNTAEASAFVGGQTRYKGVDAKSEGIELEFGGRLAEGLQATGGVTLMRIRGRSVATGEDIKARTFVPRRTARLNLSYSPPSLPGLKLGASGQYQSRIVSPSGLGRQNGYALLDLLGRYDITPNVSASVNLRNVTNKKYLTATNFDGGFYGAPRTVLGTIAVRY